MQEPVCTPRFSDYCRMQRSLHIQKPHGNVLTQWVLHLWAQGHHKKWLYQVIHSQRITGFGCTIKALLLLHHTMKSKYELRYCDKLLWSYRDKISWQNKPAQWSSLSYCSLTWDDFWVPVAHVCVAAVRMLSVVGGGALERPVRWVKFILVNALTLLCHDQSGRLCNESKTQASCAASPIYTSLTITQESWFRKERERDSRLGHI